MWKIIATCDICGKNIEGNVGDTCHCEYKKDIIDICPNCFNKVYAIVDKYENKEKEAINKYKLLRDNEITELINKRRSDK